MICAHAVRAADFKKSACVQAGSMALSGIIFSATDSVTPVEHRGHSSCKIPDCLAASFAY